jgi:hypothetical protein
MPSGDVNAIVRKFLSTNAGIIAVVGTKIYCPRIPEGTTLPAIGFFVRGGMSTPYIPPIVEPAFQFDCWGATSLVARSVYTALYDCLQGTQNQAVVIGANTYYIKSAIEEVQGQDVQDVEYPNYCRVIAFFRIKIAI